MDYYKLMYACMVCMTHSLLLISSEKIQSIELVEKVAPRDATMQDIPKAIGVPVGTKIPWCKMPKCKEENLDCLKDSCACCIALVALGVTCCCAAPIVAQECSKYSEVEDAKRAQRRAMRAKLADQQ